MAAKDLQMARTRPIRVDDVSSSMPFASDRQNPGNGSEVAMGMLRRQWPVLVLVGIAGGLIAWFVSLEYRTLTYKVDMELKSQHLPGSDQNTYTIPNAEAASEWLTSNAVLEPVIEKHGLPPVPYFLQQLSTNSNVKTGVITVTLTHTEKAAAQLILNDISDEFIKGISQYRKQILTKHGEHVSGLLLNADRELSLARSEWVKLNESEHVEDERSRSNLQLQGTIDRLIQTEIAKEEALRNLAKLKRSELAVNREIAATRYSICREVLGGRQRQAEALGQGLTKSSRIVAVKEEIDRQLAELEYELVKMAPVSEPSGDASGVSSSDSFEGGKKSEIPAGSSTPSSGASVPAKQVAGSGTSNTPGEVDTEATKNSDVGLDQEGFVPRWIEKVLSVGGDTLGDLDPQTLANIKVGETRLLALSDESRRTTNDLADASAESAFLEKKYADLQITLKKPAATPVATLSERALELEADLNRKEQRYSELSTQLERINQIRDCQLAEYVVQRPAMFVVNGEDSNRKKVFAFAFMGSSLLLLIPSAFVEFLRTRPRPINVVSRKWNLPILGTLSQGRRNSDTVTSQLPEAQPELRLMALRIQQSLFRPKGRVVLFSGLDHEESPMALIRSLARCFSQREESVLIIQAMPALTDSESTKSNRPGVAELLAGLYENADELVVGTGFPGVGFLPGGSTKGGSEVLASSRLTALIDNFRESYSMILLCGPSTLHPADLQMLAARADGIVFTVNKNSLRNVYGDEVIGDLIELGAPVLGFAEQPSTSKKAFPGEPPHGEKFILNEVPVTAISA